MQIVAAYLGGRAYFVSKACDKEKGRSLAVLEVDAGEVVEEGEARLEEGSGGFRTTYLSKTAVLGRG